MDEDEAFGYGKLSIITLVISLTLLSLIPMQYFFLYEKSPFDELFYYLGLSVAGILFGVVSIFLYKKYREKKKEQ